MSETSLCSLASLSLAHPPPPPSACRVYLSLTVFAIVLGCIGLTVYPTHSSVSSIFFGVALCIVFVIPIGVRPLSSRTGCNCELTHLLTFFGSVAFQQIIYSITNAQITLNVFAEFIGGLIYPGNALAMNYFKSYGVMACMNALAFAQDLKLAHYMKIGQRWTFAVQVRSARPLALPKPRLTPFFFLQVYGAIIATFVSTAVLNYQITLDRICQTDQPQHFICNSEATFFTATVFWGSLGPTRVFGAHGIYTVSAFGCKHVRPDWLLTWTLPLCVFQSLLWGFGIGGLLPVIAYFATKMWPKSILRYLHVPTAIYGTLACVLIDLSAPASNPFPTDVFLPRACSWGPYSTMANYFPGVIVAYFFQVWVKTRYLAWWSKYNYILAVAFGSAIPIAALLIFGGISSTSAGDVIGEWATNTIYSDNCDGSQCRRLKVDPEIGYFGAPIGSWH